MNSVMMGLCGWTIFWYQLYSEKTLLDLQPPDRSESTDSQYRSMILCIICVYDCVCFAITAVRLQADGINTESLLNNVFFRAVQQPLMDPRVHIRCTS